MSEESAPDVALKEAIESEFGMPVGESSRGHLAVTGEPYVTLCSGGIKPEGGWFPAWYETPESARDAYRKEFIEYRKSAWMPPSVCSQDEERGMRIYWRSSPELYERAVYEVDGRGKLAEATLYSVWSRLLISYQPRMEQVA